MARVRATVQITEVAADDSESRQVIHLPLAAAKAVVRDVLTRVSPTGVLSVELIVLPTEG